MDAPELQPLLGPFLDAYAALHPGMAPGDRAHATLDLAKYPPRHIDQVLLQRDAFVPLQAAVILDEPDAEGTLASDHYGVLARRSEEHTSELQSLMRISYAVFCLKKKTIPPIIPSIK